MEKEKFTIIKRIAKHGTQSIIVVPRILEDRLKPGTVTQVTIEIIDNPIEGGGENEKS
jgi:hypothetical protein